MIWRNRNMRDDPLCFKVLTFIVNRKIQREYVKFLPFWFTYIYNALTFRLKPLFSLRHLNWNMLKPEIAYSKAWKCYYSSCICDSNKSVRININRVHYSKRNLFGNVQVFWFCFFEVTHFGFYSFQSCLKSFLDVSVKW